MLMKGDKNISRSTFVRWMEWTCDGAHELFKGNGKRTPSSHPDKKRESRWKRRKGKEDLGNENNQAE